MEHSVGIIVHRTNQRAWGFAHEVIAWLQGRGVTVRLDEETAHKLQRVDLACCQTIWEAVDFVITLGGDGTILTAARMAAPHSIPILGVHMGRFGFIAETHPSTLFPNLQRALSGEMNLEERLRVHAEIWRDGECVHRTFGLNDAVVKSSSFSLLNLRIFLAGAPFATYPADGVIVATPTGSTGYSLSAGGPLVEPTIKALIITPICPHTLSARPMVIPSNDLVEVLVEEEEGDVLFKIDGVDPFSVHQGDRIVVRPADYVTRLMIVDHASFYRKVRARYLYGERLNASESGVE